MSRLPYVALVLAMAGGTAVAQPAPAPANATFEQAIGALLGQPGGLTSDAAAKRAATASPAAQRKAAELAEAETSSSSIALALVPRTKLTASYTRLSDIELPATGFMIPIHLNNYHLGAEVAVPLTELFLHLPPLRRATDLGVDAARAGVKASELTASTDARVAYYEWVRAELQVVVAQRLLVQVTGNLDQVRALAEAQRVSKADVLRLEAARAQAELAVAQVGQLVALRGEQLRIAIGAGPDEPLTIGEDVREVGAAAEVGSTAELLRGALGRRVELDALTAGREALRQQRKAAKVQRLPQLAIFAQANYDNPNQRNFLGDAEFSFTWAAGASATWSLNDFLDARPDDAKLAAQERALAADRAGLELGIRGEITSARQAVLLADASYAATRQGLAAAEESYRVRQELLAAERATALELVDAESELTRARIAAIDALIDRRIAWARLRHATGEDAK